MVYLGKGQAADDAYRPSIILNIVMVYSRTQLLYTMLNENQTKCKQCSVFFFVFKGWTAWQRRCARRAILDATEVLFAHLIPMTNNTISVLYYKLNPATYAVVSPVSPQSRHHQPTVMSHELLCRYALFVYLSGNGCVTVCVFQVLQ